MPLGNSITQGYTDGTITVAQMKGYRYDLKQLLLGSGYSIDFVGSESSGNTYFADCQHAGIGGSRDQYVARLLIDGYDQRWGVQILNPPRPYLDEFNPDIILLHIGTNDCTHETDVITNQKVSYILDLIDQYEARANHEVIVFLALIVNRQKPWVAGSGAATTTAFNNAIRTMAQSRVTNGDKLVIVDMENDASFVYDATDMADLLHPNAAGYLKMANLWKSLITANYNTAPVIAAIPDQGFNEGESGVLALDNYVTDIEDTDQNITWSIEQIGTPKLTIALDANRQAIFEPLDSEWSGTQKVAFKATDKGKNNKYIKSATDTIIITVYPVNDAPVFTSSPILTIDKEHLYTYTFSAIDIDPGDILQYSLLEKPSWLTLYGDSRLLAGIPIQQGNYPVTLSVYDGHINIDQTFTIKVLGPSPVFETEAGSPLNIYPNPASDHFTIMLPKNADKIDFMLYDFIGKLVLKRSICADCESSIDIQCGNLMPGVYSYMIILEKETYVGKLLIKR